MRQKDVDAIADVLADEFRFAAPAEIPGLVAAAGAMSRAWAKSNGPLDTSRMAEMAAPESVEPSGCGACWECVPSYRLMRVCATCGAKRCPHAKSHRYPCTDSNDRDQPGSRYSNIPHPLDA